MLADPNPRKSTDVLCYNASFVFIGCVIAESSATIDGTVDDLTARTISARGLAIPGKMVSTDMVFAGGEVPAFFQRAHDGQFHDDFYFCHEALDGCQF